MADLMPNGLSAACPTVCTAQLFGRCAVLLRAGWSTSQVLESPAPPMPCMLYLCCSSLLSMSLALLLPFLCSPLLPSAPLLI